jgi:hypothetical protein
MYNPRPHCGFYNELGIQILTRISNKFSLHYKETKPEVAEGVLMMKQIPILIKK